MKKSTEGLFQHPVKRMRLLIWVYLAALGLMLATYKWQIVPFPKHSYLLLLNTNLVAASALSCVVAYFAARLDRRWWLWLALVFLLMVGEIVFFSIDFIFTGVDNDDFTITLPTGIWLAARIVLLTTLALQLAGAPKQSRFRLSRIFPPALGFIAVAAFTAVPVVLLLREFASPTEFTAPLAFLFSNLIAFALMAVISAKGSPLSPKANPFLFWPMLGFGLYMIGDIFYFLDAARRPGDFCLWEMGYFCGYLLTALGGLEVIKRPGETLTSSV